MARKYYGQSGEDFLVWHLFEGVSNGVYLDVGAHDGVKRSNTVSFEVAGWKGMCIEPHPFYFAKCRYHRPKAIVVHAAAASADKENVPFYTTEFGALSTLNKEMGPFFKEHFNCFSSFKEVKVPTRKVDTLLAQHKFTHLDFVSIDVEGSEMEVLKGFTIPKYNPRALVIEAVVPSGRPVLVDYMKTLGYICALQIGDEFFFCKTQQDVDIIKTAHETKK